jgi:hypothetical protein
MHLGRLEPAEMEEAEGAPVHLPSVVLKRQSALPQVPVGDIHRRIAQNVSAVAEARDKVHELLINKDPLVLCANALVLQPSSPPGEDKVCFGPGMHSQEPQVKDSSSHDHDVIGISVNFGRGT